MIATLRRPSMVQTRVRKQKCPRGPSYKVIIFDVDDVRVPNVTHILTCVFKDMTENEAKTKAHEAQTHGRSIVQICIQVQAEDYCEKLRTYDLKSIIEPY